MAGETLAKTEYLEFIDATPAGRKTRVVLIRSVNHGDVLGEVRWYGAWRQYCFYPRTGTIWNTTCLGQAQAFLKWAMNERRAN